LSTEARNSFETEWVSFKDEVFSKLGLEFSIRLSLLASDQGMDPLGDISDGMCDSIITVIKSRVDQVGDYLFDRAQTEGVGFYTFAMFEVTKTSNKLALEVIKNAVRDGRRQIAEADLAAAIEATRAASGHWPIS
jgi:hypothetical protein